MADGVNQVGFVIEGSSAVVGGEAGRCDSELGSYPGQVMRCQGS